jgi:hypothetical protein
MKAMKLTVTHVLGARKGSTQHFDQRVVRLGRDPQNDVAFDAQADIDASTRHAEIRFEDGRYWVVDTGSTNGTFVNGNRVDRQALTSGDVIEFAPGGPKVRVDFQGVPATRVDAAVAGAVSSSARGSAIGSKTVAMMINDALSSARTKGGVGGTAVFVKELVNDAVRSSSRKQRAVAGVIVLALSAGIVYLALENREQQAQMAAAQVQFDEAQEAAAGHMATLQSELDASLAQVGDLERQSRDAQNQLTDLSAQRAEINSALAGATQRLQELQRNQATMAESQRQEVARLESQVAEFRDRNGELEQEISQARTSSVDIETRLAEVIAVQQEASEQYYAALEASTRTAGTSAFPEIASNYEDGIFLIGVEYPGQPRIGVATGFLVNERGLIATAAHVADIFDIIAEAAVRRGWTKQDYKVFAIQNNDPFDEYEITEAFPHPDWNRSVDSPDVAVVRIFTRGQPLSPVLELADEETLYNLTSGVPIALMGFPGQTIDLQLPVASFVSGTIGRQTDFANRPVPPMQAALLQHSIPTQAGTSGSPIFDTEGRVVAVHHAGVYSIDSNGRLVAPIVGLSYGIRTDKLREVLFSVQ